MSTVAKQLSFYFYFTIRLVVILTIMMDLKTTSFVGFLQERANKRKKPNSNVEPVSVNGQTAGNFSGGQHWPALSANAPKKQLEKSPYNNPSNGHQSAIGLTRSQEIELKLDAAMKEAALPGFEQLVEHLQGRKRFYDEDGAGGLLLNCDLLDSPVQLPRGGAAVLGNDSWNGSSSSHHNSGPSFDLDDISIVSSSVHKRRSSNMSQDELLFANKNYHLLLKELLPLI